MSTKLASHVERHAAELIEASTPLTTGTRGRIRTVTVDEDTVAIKTALDDAPPNTVRNEATHNEAANDVGVGPTMYHYDEEHDAMFRAFIPGFHFDDWARYQATTGRNVRPTLRAIYEQCRRLDRRGMHRPELSRPHDDIIISDEPVIIDFERCRFQRKPTNVLHFTECLLRKRYAAMFDVVDRMAKKQSIREDCKAYKEKGEEAVYERLRSTVLDWVTC